MPDWKDLIRKQVADLNLAPAREAEIIEEFAQHVADRYRELLNGGASEEEARRGALEEINNREQLAGELRTVERTNVPDTVVWGGSPLRDIRYGVRSLRKSPGFMLVVVAVLGLGIGANVAMFSLVDAAFLRPLRLPDPARLVQIQQAPPSGGYMPVSYPDFVDWEKQAGSFESMGIAGVFPETLKSSGGNERVQAAYISPGFLSTLGVSPLAGRALTPADDRPGAPPAVLLSHRFWQSHFAGDPAAVGRMLTLGDQVWTIVGVMPPFRWQRNADIFVPITFGMDRLGLNMRENHSGTGVTARLKPGVTLEQARAEMNLIADRLAKQYPGSNGGVGAVVVPLRDYIGGDTRHTILLMFGAVGLLLLASCANVAGLLLARAAVRQREMAIRAALGAGRLQLIRQLLVESLLLALAGAAAGVALAAIGLAGLQRIFPVADNLGGIAIDARVLAFSVGVAALTAILFGLTPALRFTQPNMIDAIKAGGRGTGAGAVHMHVRKLLVVSQVALAVVLSTGAGLLMRSLLAVLHTDPGFHPEHVVAAHILPPDRKDADFAQTSQLLRDTSARLAALPGVQAAGAVDDLAFSNADSWGDFYRDDRPIPSPGQLPNAMKAAATPGFFPAMGIPLLRGRLFTQADAKMPPLKRDIPSVLAYLRTVELVAVINETMARRFWPGEDPVGKTFRFGPPSLQGPRVRIVGVVGDFRQFGLDRPPEPQYIFSADQFPMLDARLVVRAELDLAALAPIIRGAVAEHQPDAVVTSVDPMETLVDRTLAGRQNNLALLGLFSGVTLLLAALGLYATMAYMVSQRTQEIGVRMALGAASADVRRMVLREGAALAAFGVAIGLIAALAGARLVSSMLYGVTDTDALTYLASALLLVLVMLAASSIPAWRASRVHPMEALRSE